MFGLGAGIGAVAIPIGGVLGFFGIPFLIPILVPAGFLIGGVMAGSRLENRWPGAALRIAGSFATGGTLTLLSLLKWPSQEDRNSAAVVIFCAIWFVAAFAFAAVVAAFRSDDRPWPFGRVFQMYVIGGLVGATMEVAMTRMVGFRPSLVVPLAIMGGFATTGTLMSSMEDAKREAPLASASRNSAPPSFPPR